MSVRRYAIGETVTAYHIAPLKGKSVAPPLEKLKDYVIFSICEDKKGNQHLDVGLLSEYNYITSFETGEELPNGDKIHWCHPSRFEE